MDGGEELGAGMSEGQRIPYSLAVVYARDLQKILTPYCDRIQVAGSIRRQKENIGDIEMVVIQKPSLDLFGELVISAEPVKSALLAAGYILKLGGNKYLKCLAGNVQCDIFITTPEQWGVIYTIRTGSADFSHRLVTPKMHGGLMPSNMRVKDGRVWIGETVQETREEIDVFNLFGLGWVEPKERL